MQLALTNKLNRTVRPGQINSPGQDFGAVFMDI
jgi:hypothetical protein